MKTINAEKLEAMGIDRVRKTCMFHATIACREGGPGGNNKLYERHISLLDQCAAVGRKIIRDMAEPPKVPQRRWTETAIA